MSKTVIWSLVLLSHISRLSGLPPSSTDDTLYQLDDYYQEDVGFDFQKEFGFDKALFPVTGANQAFECPYTPIHHSPKSVRWFHAENEIPNRSQGHQRKTVAKDGRLHIQRVKKGDSGTYRCEAHFTNTVQSRILKLVIQEKPSIIRTSPKIRKTAVGRTTFLKCTGAGKPQPTTVWLKNEKELNMAKSTRYEALGHSLIIKDILREDAGVYTCIVRNVYGEDEATFVLTVQEPVRPRILYITPEVKTKEGSNVTLYCTATNRYHNTSIKWEVVNTNFSWIRDSETSTKRKHHTVTSQLMLRNLRPTTQTPIVCIARNQIGRVTATMELSVGAGASA